jgi:hypothetical protein
MNPNDFEKVISNAKSGGWDWFENLDQKVQGALSLEQERAAEDRRAILHAWAEFARSPGGRKALDQLFDVTLRRTVYFASLGMDAHSMAVFGAFREGQCSVAHMIARMVAAGSGEDTKPRDV